MTDVLPLLRVLGIGGVAAVTAADVVVGLVRQGGELGELERREISDGGVTRIVKVMPRAWVTRLSRAAELGAFERLSKQQIIDRILMPPETPVAR